MLLKHRACLLFAAFWILGGLGNSALAQFGGKDFLNALKNTVEPEAQQNSTPRAPRARRVDYAGYTAGFNVVRPSVRSGDFSTALNAYESSRITKDKFLRPLELGALATDAGNFETAIEHFADAEKRFEKRAGKDKFSTDFNNTMSSVVGIGDGGKFVGSPYEQILMLNYKTIAYLSLSDRRAFNVASRAADWQNFMRDQVRKKVAIEKARQEEAASQAASDDERSASIGFKGSIKKQYDAYDVAELNLPDSYVNPLGDYLTGVVYEFDALEESDNADNARIAYEKALELRPGSRLLKKAVADMSARRLPADNQQLVHLLVAADSAPEKKLLSYDIVGILPEPVAVRMPVLEPVAAQIGRIEVRNKAGALLSRMSPLADIEAIALRHQKDMADAQSGDMAMRLVRTYFRRKAVNQIGGLASIVANGAVDQLDMPDMKSWASLPRAYHAARIVVPTSVKDVVIIAFDTKGRKVSERNITLSAGRKNFVYGRAMGSELSAFANPTEWKG